MPALFPSLQLQPEAHTGKYCLRERIIHPSYCPKSPGKQHNATKTKMTTHPRLRTQPANGSIPSCLCFHFFWSWPLSPLTRSPISASHFAQAPPVPQIPGGKGVGEHPPHTPTPTPPCSGEGEGAAVRSCASAALPLPGRTRGRGGLRVRQGGPAGVGCPPACPHRRGDAREAGWEWWARVSVHLCAGGISIVPPASPLRGGFPRGGAHRALPSLPARCLADPAP